MIGNASCTSRADRAENLWLTICSSLGGKSAIDLYGLEIIQAAGSYRRERRIGLKNKARAKRLNKIVMLCDDLAAEIAESRDWLNANLDAVEWGGVNVHAIIEDEASPLRALRESVKTALENLPDQSGKEAVYFRRRFWTCLAAIYEDATERRAATSKNKDGIIQGDFVRLVVAVTEYINPTESVSPDMVDQFIDWYRGPESSDLREEIAEVRMLAAAVRTTG